MIHKIFLFIALSVSVISSAQPEEVKKLHETAKSFMRSGDFDNAIIVLTRALQQDKKNLELEKDLVMSYYFKREYSKALEGAKSLIDRDDADAVARLSRFSRLAATLHRMVFNPRASRCYASSVGRSGVSLLS